MKKWILILGFLTINLMLDSIRAEEPDRSICGDYGSSIMDDFVKLSIFENNTFTESYFVDHLELKGSWEWVMPEVLVLNTNNLEYYSHFKKCNLQTDFQKNQEELCIRTHFLKVQKETSQSITVNVNGKLFTTQDSVLKIPYQAIEFYNDSLINVRFFINRYGNLDPVFQSENPPVVIFNKTFNLSEMNALDVTLPYYEYYINKAGVYTTRFVLVDKLSFFEKLHYPNYERKFEGIILKHDPYCYEKYSINR